MDDELRWYLLAKKRTESQIVSAFRVFRRQGIEPVLIKGWAAARNYPSDVPRFYGDTDLAVSADDYAKAKTLVEGPEAEAKGVDLHRELRHLDTLDWHRLTERSELVEVDGEGIRILAPEDHLRVMCSHWLTNGGGDRERLFDIYYAVQNRRDSFDWSRCLDVVTSNRRSWVIATVGLAHRYLGLSLDDIPFAREAEKLPRWLTTHIERAWADGSRLRGIDESITDRKVFVRQIKNRLPPNPIQATIFCEAAFDDRSRVSYQVRDMFGRMIPSVRRLSRALANQYRWKMRTK
jgi:hypothetical protein